MGKHSTDIIDEVFQGMERTFERKTEPEDLKAITLWVPAECHERFEELQKKTNREFGRRLRTLVKKTIEKVGA